MIRRDSRFLGTVAMGCFLLALVLMARIARYGTYPRAWVFVPITVGVLAFLAAVRLDKRRVGA